MVSKGEKNSLKWYFSKPYFILKHRWSFWIFELSAFLIMWFPLFKVSHKLKWLFMNLQFNKKIFQRLQKSTAAIFRRINSYSSKQYLVELFRSFNFNKGNMNFFLLSNFPLFAGSSYFFFFAEYSASTLKTQTKIRKIQLFFYLGRTSTSFCFSNTDICRFYFGEIH